MAPEDPEPRARAGPAQGGRAPRLRPPEQEHRKETSRGAADGEPGYGEPPPEVRQDKLPDQDW